MVVEYNYLLTHQLDQQRAFFQQQLAFLQQDTSR
jgi:hypothetical protein